MSNTLPTYYKDIFYPTQKEIDKAVVESVNLETRSGEYFITTNCEIEVTSLGGFTTVSKTVYLRSDGHWYDECTTTGMYYTEEQATEFLQTQLNK